MRFYKPNKGASLPSLSNPASRDNIQAGFEAIDGTGKKVVGQLFIDKFYTKKNVAIPLETQYRAGIPYADTMLHMAESAGNATAADIVKGKTALTDDGKITGTLEVTGGEPSWNFEIATENTSDGTDRVLYYTAGSSEKSLRSLTSTYQTIFCGDFICISRGSTGNTTSMIAFLDENNDQVLTVSVSVNPKYAVNAVPNGGFCTVNIRAIKRDYPTASKIMLKYLS